MKIFIDDERYPLKGEEGDWIIVREAQAAIDLIRANAAQVTHISFDNDLGCDLQGRDVMNAVLGTPVSAPIPLPRLVELRVHSANVPAFTAMMEIAQCARDNGVLRPNVRIEGASALYIVYPNITSWYDDAYEDEKDRLAALAGGSDDVTADLQRVEERYGIIMEGNGVCRLP